MPRGGEHALSWVRACRRGRLWSMQTSLGWLLPAVGSVTHSPPLLNPSCPSLRAFGTGNRLPGRVSNPYTRRQEMPLTHLNPESLSRIQYSARAYWWRVVRFWWWEARTASTGKAISWVMTSNHSLPRPFETSLPFSRRRCHSSRRGSAHDLSGGSGRRRGRVRCSPGGLGRAPHRRLGDQGGGSRSTGMSGGGQRTCPCELRPIPVWDRPGLGKFRLP